MPTVILLRHARSTANGSGILAGRTPGVALDEKGQAQAATLVGRLSPVPLAEIVRSPLQRCGETVAELAGERGLEPVIEDRFAEVDYGDWSGRKIHELVKEPLWTVVQQHPSAAVFPGGEGLAAVQARAVAAVREHDARIAEAHGPRAVWLLCSHGDVIASVLADALGQHLDSYQRLVIDPASMSVIRYTHTRPFVLRMNDNGGDLSGIVPPEPPAEEPKDGAAEVTDAVPADSDAVPGGTTGG